MASRIRTTSLINKLQLQVPFSLGSWVDIAADTYPAHLSTRVSVPQIAKWVSSETPDDRLEPHMLDYYSMSQSILRSVSKIKADAAFGDKKPNLLSLITGIDVAINGVITALLSEAVETIPYSAKLSFPNNALQGQTCSLAWEAEKRNAHTKFSRTLARLKGLRFKKHIYEIENMPIYCVLGIHSEERQRGQILNLSIAIIHTMDQDVPIAGGSVGGAGSRSSLDQPFSAISSPSSTTSDSPRTLLPPGFFAQLSQLSHELILESQFQTLEALTVAVARASADLIVKTWTKVLGLSGLEAATMKDPESDGNAEASGSNAQAGAEESVGRMYHPPTVLDIDEAGTWTIRVTATKPSAVALAETAGNEFEMDFFVA
jgi:hypothetical protein